MDDKLNKLRKDILDLCKKTTETGITKPSRMIQKFVNINKADLITEVRKLINNPVFNESSKKLIKQGRLDLLLEYYIYTNKDIYSDLFTEEDFNQCELKLKEAEKIFLESKNNNNKIEEYRNEFDFKDESSNLEKDEKLSSVHNKNDTSVYFEDDYIEIDLKVLEQHAKYSKYELIELLLQSNQITEEEAIKLLKADMKSFIKLTEKYNK